MASSHGSASLNCTKISVRLKMRLRNRRRPDETPHPSESIERMIDRSLPAVRPQNIDTGTRLIFSSLCSEYHSNSRENRSL